jgi:iron complex outermembrane recepter protein
MNKPTPQKTLIAASLCLAMTSPLHAQTLEDVVVSASRSEQSSFDAPAAINSVNREAIENAGPQVNLSEALRQVPGVTILNRQNYAQDLQLSIRGFGARTAFGIRGVRIIVDGIPATMPDGQGQASTISLTSTDRIEVLRGPLAQLYGNAAGGVIQAFTREAPDTPELTVQTALGSFDTVRTGIQYAAKSGAYGLVADYGEFETDGYRDNSATKRKHFNGKLTWQDGPTKIAFIANVFDMPKAQDPGGLSNTWENDPTAAGVNFEARNVRKTVEQEQAGVVATHNYRNGVKLTGRVYAGTRGVFQVLRGTSTPTWIEVDREYSGIGLQLTKNSGINGIQTRWTLGAEYDRAREDRTGGAMNAVGSVKTGQPTRNQDYLTYNQDYFGQIEIYPSEAITLVAGFRSSAVTMDVNDRKLNEDYAKITHRAISPVAGFTWHLSPTVNFYANIGKGFETPAVAETSYKTGPTEPLDDFNSELKPSRSKHGEVGIKALVSQYSRLELALYKVKTQNEIVIEQGGLGPTSYKNAAQTDRRGAEFTFRSTVSDQWRVTAALNILSAEYSKSFKPVDSATPIPSGNKLPGIPQGYRFAELAWSSTGWSLQKEKSLQQPRTIAGIEVISSGRLFANDANDRVANGYDIANLRLSHELPVGPGRLSLLARIDNAFDKQYVGSVIVGNSTPYEPSPGRNWLIGAKYTLTM